MSEPKWCPQCGAQHAGEAPLCEPCRAAGVVLAPPAEPERPPAPPVLSRLAPPAKKGSAKRLGVQLLAAGAVLGVLAMVWAWPSPERAPQATGIAGEYWRDLEPAGRPKKMSLCPDGRYFEYANRLGRWTAVGDDRGTVFISLDADGGEPLELGYRILREKRFCSPAGCDAEFNGSRYGRDPTLGNCR